MAEQKPICFVISPIGPEGSEKRIRADKVSRHLIERAADSCGYLPLRADKMSDPGMITSQVIQLVIEAPMLIADLSEHNPNVFYELAIRHALRKPYVQIVHKDWLPIPFDLSVTRTVIFDLDPDVLEAKRVELVDSINTVKGREDVDSPISNAIDVEHMRRSGNPQHRQLADVISSVAELKQELNSMNRLLQKVTILQGNVPELSPSDVAIPATGSVFAEKLREVWRRKIPELNESA